MSKSKSNGTNFLVQGSILAMASIISRMIGLIYRIPMTNIIGDIGNGYYGTAFEVYNVMLIISSYSLPLAVSKLVSARRALGQKRNIYQLLKGALLFATIAGLLVSLILFFGASFFAGVLQTPEAKYALRVLAPTLLIVAILGALRGFFQGLGTMMPSAVSQIIEQVVNAIVSVWAAYVLFHYGKKVGAVLGDPDNYAAAYGAAGGTLGTNIGALFGLLFVLFIFVIYMTIFKRQMKRERNRDVEPFAYTMKILIVTIIPVLLSTTVYNISGIVEQYLFKNISALQGYGSAEINVYWGVFTGKYKLLTNVPISIASAMAASSVPTLTASFSNHDMDAVRNKLHAATRLVMVIAFPCTVGLGVLGKPIIRLLFPGTISTLDLAGNMMYLGAIAVIFYSLSTLSNGLLQGINRLKIPVTNALISLVSHAVLLVILMLVFHLNIQAVVISNAFFALMMCVLNQMALAKYSGYRIEWKKSFILPCFASLIMGVAVFAAYHGAYALIHMNSVSTLFAILIAVVTYFVSLLLLKGVDEPDMLSFPKGAMLVRIAKKLHLLHE